MPNALRADKVRGVHLAIVAENTEGDGNPGYRVKVKLPWLSEQEKTYWARIAIPMGGPERGTYFLPEVEDQLLVVFEHGDVDRPIVIGALWSKKQEPVEVNASGKNNTKLIKSRSGHRVIFDDKEGAEKVIIVDKTKKNQIVLDTAAKLVKIECAGDITVKAKANVIMHSNALKMGITQTLKGKGQQMLAHSAATFGFKAGSEITISASAITINVSNSAATTVSGSGAGELGAIAEEKAKDQIEAKDRAAAGGGGGGGGGAAAGAGGGAAGGAGAGAGGGAAGAGGTAGPAPSNFADGGGTIRPLTSGPGGGTGGTGAGSAPGRASGEKGNTRPAATNNTFEQARTSDDVGRGAGTSGASENARNNPGAGSGAGGTFEDARTSRNVGAGAGASGASEDARGGPGAGAGASGASEDARGGPGAGAGASGASEDARGGPGDRKSVV